MLSAHWVLELGDKINAFYKTQNSAFGDKAHLLHTISGCPWQRQDANTFHLRGSNRAALNLQKPWNPVIPRTVWTTFSDNHITDFAQHQRPSSAHAFSSQQAQRIRRRFVNGTDCPASGPQLLTQGQEWGNDQDVRGSISGCGYPTAKMWSNSISIKLAHLHLKSVTFDSTTAK